MSRYVIIPSLARQMPSHTIRTAARDVVNIRAANTNTINTTTALGAPNIHSANTNTVVTAVSPA